MKRKANISHDKAIVRELRDNNPGFAAEYLRAALEDDDEPGVLLGARVYTAPCRFVGTPAFLRSSP
jgi:DNA-binding phage protein